MSPDEGFYADKVSHTHTQTQIETFHDRRLRFKPTLSRSRLKHDLLKTALGLKPVPICFRCVFVGINVTEFDKNASV